MFIICLDTSPATDTRFTNISCHGVGCLCTRLVVSFDVRMLLIWVMSNFNLFSFAACDFGVLFKKSMPILRL